MDNPKSYVDIKDIKKFSASLKQVIIPNTTPITYSMCYTTEYEIYKNYHHEMSWASELYWVLHHAPSTRDRMCAMTLFSFITMTSYWARWRLKSPASRLFTQTFIQTQIEENIKALRHWPLRGIHWGPVNSPHKWPVTRKMFPFDDVIMLVACSATDVMVEHRLYSALWIYGRT